MPWEHLTGAGFHFLSAKVVFRLRSGGVGVGQQRGPGTLFHLWEGPEEADLRSPERQENRGRLVCRGRGGGVQAAATFWKLIRFPWKAPGKVGVGPRCFSHHPVTAVHENTGLTSGQRTSVL